MKKYAFLVLALAAASCAPQRQSISVRMDGWGNDTVFVDYSSNYGSKDIRDTLIARRGRFEVPVIDTIPMATVYRAGGNGTMIFTMPPENRMSVHGGQKDRHVEYTVKGSALNSEIAEYLMQTWAITLERQDAMTAIKSAPGDEEAVKRMRAATQKIWDAERKFREEHPSSEWSLYLLTGTSGTGKQLAALTESAREGRFRPMFDRYAKWMEESQKAHQRILDEQKKQLSDKPAPDFAATDMTGNEFKLSEYDSDGRYIVLDFWGSWCVPCIAGMPRMKKYYESHKDRLEVIGIACFDSEDKWKKAVTDNALPWVNVLDNDSAPKVYELSMYPTKIILSPDKQVVAVYPGEGDSFYRKLDELFKK